MTGECKNWDAAEIQRETDHAIPCQTGMRGARTDLLTIGDEDERDSTFREAQSICMIGGQTISVSSGFEVKPLCGRPKTDMNTKLGQRKSYYALLTLRDLLPRN